MPNAQEEHTPATIPFMTKRIGNTTYNVSAQFSQTSTETLDKKILRMIKNDIGSVTQAVS